ncbi:MAG: stage II sporulation protein D [Clostridiales bacterium]|nr:stage II sporulation protein D [Clostridiales bacterium]
MKQIFIKTCIVCIVVLLFPFLLTLFLTYSKENSNSIETMNFNITYQLSGNVENLDFDRYIMGVVAANMPAGYHMEALKAQAVIARTYALYNIALLTEEGHKNQNFSTSELGLSYIDISEMEQYWGSENYMTYFTKIENAVYATRDEVLVYEGDLILPVFFETGSGYTRNASEAWGLDIPYLTSVSSKYDVTSTNYLKISEYSTSDLIQFLEKQYPEINLTKENFLNEVSLAERDSAGYVTKVNLGNQTVTGEEIAKALGLNSSHFYLEDYNGKIRIITTGVGHGVGLSQYSCNAMAQEGSTYPVILCHFYTGAEIITLNK